ARGVVEPRLAEDRLSVEGSLEPAADSELGVDRLHQLLTEEVGTALTLVEQRRVVVERLDEEQLGPEQAAEVFHGRHHPAEESEAATDLPGREAGSEGPR